MNYPAWCGVLPIKSYRTLRITAVPSSSGSDSEDEDVTSQKTQNLLPQLTNTVLARAEQYKPLLHRH